MNEIAEIMLTTQCGYPDEDMAQVDIQLPEGLPFGYLMVACEYLLYFTAGRSSAGFEKALELLCEGAMNWRTKKGGGQASE